MDTPLTPPDNNLRELTPYEFILILAGRNSDYIYPNSHQRVNEEEGIRLANERGEQYSLYYITIPYAAWEFPFTRQQILNNPNHGIDLTRPIITKISGTLMVSATTLNYAIRGNAPFPNSFEYIKTFVIPREVRIRDCYFLPNIVFKKVQSEFDITFQNCKYFDPTNSPTTLSFTFDKCSFKNIQFINNKLPASMDGCLNELIFIEVTTTSLTLENIRVHTLKIDAQQGDIESIVIIDCVIDKLFILGRNAKKISIVNLASQDIVFIEDFNELVISSNQPKTNIDEPIVKQISLHFSPQRSNENLVVRDCDFSNISLTGVLNGKVLIKACRIGIICFNELSNLGDMRFHNISGIKAFLVQDSSLGKAEFMNININKETRVQIVGSTIFDTVLNNTVFPGNLIAVDRDDYSGIREVFRQLKLSSAKQGNTIRELEYRALEMDTYEKDIYANKSWTDKIILFTNKYSNNHGTNWQRAIFGLLITTIPLFIYIKSLLGYNLIFGLSMPDFGSMVEYFNFSLNPLHDFAKVFEHAEGDKIGLAKFLDVIAKFLAGYFLYQFVQAFRKFSK